MSASVRFQQALTEQPWALLRSTLKSAVDAATGDVPLAAIPRSASEPRRQGVIAVVPIHLPQQRHSKEEMPRLVQHLLERQRQRLHLEVESVDPEAMEVLLAYSWPGNIRELENVIERAVVICDGPAITLAELPEELTRETTSFASVDVAPPEVPPTPSGDLSVPALASAKSWSMKREILGL